MSEHVIKMPDLGEGIAEVELVAWHVAVGDAVREDQPLADVMTDKATVEIPSPVAGTVVSLGGEVGQVLAVGAELIRIALDAQRQGGATRRTDPDTQTGDGTSSAGMPPRADAVPAQPLAAAQPAAPVRDAAPAVAPPAAGMAHEKPLASPAVRHHARQLGIDLAAIPGTGPGGRIVHDDLLAHASASGAANEIPAGAAAPAVCPETPPPDATTAPVIGLRRQIARNMRQSLRVPHFTYVEEVDVSDLEALRTQLNRRHEGERPHLTLLPFIVRAMVLAIGEFPQVNAHYDEEAETMTQYAAVHLGIAAHTEAGLMVPVLRHAETLDLWACASEIVRLTDLARAGKARREDLGGSSISLTSLGPLGGIVSTPVINPPAVAIIGVNRMVQRPVVRDGLIVPRSMMNLSSSFDHRALDGMVAAQFIQAVRRLLEYPALLFVPD